MIFRLRVVRIYLIFLCFSQALQSFIPSGKETKNKYTPYDVQVDGTGCPGIKSCINCCRWGRTRDEYGCLNCDCLNNEEHDDEVRLKVDMHENERWEKDANNCPGIDQCESCCPLGRIRDSKGCLTCKCITKGTFSDLVISDLNYEQFFEKFGIKPSNKIVSKRQKRAAYKENYLWKQYKIKNNYIVPYVFGKDTSSQMRKVVRKSIKSFKRKTCIRFEPKKSKQNFYVKFTKSSGCASYVGNIFPGQPIYLGPGCLTYRIVIHEMMHALGFDHEQSRPDRDRYVNVFLRNVTEEGKDGFVKMPGYKWDSYKSPYDIYSVMHYSSSTFTSNGKSTLLTKDGEKIWKADDFSYEDIVQINKMYSCSANYFKKAKQEFNLVKCRDKMSKGSCESLKSFGKCAEVSTRKKCPETCGACLKDVKKPKPTLTPTTKTMTKCFDAYTFCAEKKRKGYCTNPRYKTSMSRICKKSCKLCNPSTQKPITTTKIVTTTPTARCRDLKRTCPFWKSRGICLYHPTYMRVNCPLSCGFCINSITRPKTTTKPKTTTTKPKTTTTKPKTTTTKPKTTTTKPKTTTTKPKTTTTKPKTTTTKPKTTTTKLKTTTAKPKTTTTKPKTTTTKPKITTTKLKITTTKPRTTANPTTISVTCEDKKRKCANWAKNGRCKSSKFKKMMRKYCKLSCRRCKTLNPTTTSYSNMLTTPLYGKTTTKAILSKVTSTKTLSTRFTTVKPICRDKVSSCSSWTVYCRNKKYEIYMRINCKKTCGRC